MSVHIALLIEDLHFTADVKARLEGRDTEIFELGSLEDLHALGESYGIDVAIVDTDFKGRALLKELDFIRGCLRGGLIALSRSAGIGDRLLALAAGVDHYLVKPAEPCEIELIVRNLTRHQAQMSAQRQDEIGERWIFESDSWTLISPEGHRTPLSAAEHEILLPLIGSPGTAFSRAQLNASLGKTADIFANNRSLDVLISRLRRKVEKHTGRGLPLRSARGTGYVFVAEVQIAASSPAALLTTH